jgi:hypothetical protein
MTTSDLLPGNQETYEIDEQFLNDYWLRLVGNETGIAADRSRHIFVEGFKRLSSGEDDPALLYLKTKGWRLSVKDHLIKNLLVAPAIGGLLYYLGYTQIAGFLIPTILPMLFDLRNIELKRSEEEILIKLPIDPKKKEFKTSSQWYHSLPPSIKKQVNELDFMDFIEKLVLAGYAKKNDKDKYLVFQKGKNKFNFSIE